MGAGGPSRTTRRWALRAGVGAGALLIGASLIVLGPAGPTIAASLAEGAPVWRLGVLHVERVSGSGLGDLRVARTTLADEKGVWAEADNLRLRWKPLQLIFGKVALSDASAAELRVLRLPTLAPPARGGAVKFDTEAPAIAIARIDLAAGVAGPAAVFRGAGGASVKRGALKALHLDLTRIDQPLDLVSLDFAAIKGLRLAAKIEGAPGGVFAHLAGTPNRRVRLAATASGDGQAGRGALDSFIGDARLAAGTLDWTQRGWSAEGSVRLAVLPAADSLARRFGPLVAIAAAGDPLRPIGAPFHAALGADHIDGEARGKLDDDLKVVGALALSINAKHLQTVAHELNIASGAGRFDGAAEFESGRTRLSGRLGVTHAALIGLDVSVEGPVEVFVRPSDISFSGDLGGGEIGAPAALKPLFKSARLSLKGRYDRSKGDWRFTDMMVKGPEGVVTAVGAIDEAGARFRGNWDFPRLGAVLADTKGAARGQWTIAAAPHTAPTLTIDGAARGFSGLDPFGAMLGPTPKLDASVRFEDHGAAVDRVRIEGPRLRVGGRGMVVGNNVNLALEASARGPARVAGVQVAGAADATGKLTGQLDSPRLDLEARLATLDVNGVTLHNARATLSLAPDGARRSGQATLEAALAGKPARAAARVALGPKTLGFEDLTLSWAQLRATGRAESQDGRLAARLVLSGALDGLAPDMSGPVSGALSYAAAKGGDTLRMNASLKRARLSRTIAADEASVSVEGPLKTLALRYAIKGWANEQPFDLGGEGQGGIDKSGMNAAIAVKGAFAGAPIATREPISARLSGDVLQAAGAVTLDHGSLQASWRSDKTNAAIDARFDEAPLEVLTAMLEQPAAGALSGEMHLAGAKKSLSGAADLTFKEARMARRSRDVVNARLTATLGGGALHGRLEARSGRGLAATLEGETPMVAEAAPFRLAPRAGGVTTATWKVDGPVEGLWALFGPLDQSLSGQINGAGDMRVAEAGVSGRGQVTLTAGAFDDKISGVKLRQVNAALSFDDQGMTLNRFEATDGLQGRVTGSGRLDVQDSGKLSLTLANMRLFDRPEGRATGDGDLTLEWRKGGATLGGTIRLAQAEMRLIDGAATAPLPQIDVVEINRPGPPPRAAKRGGSVIASKLDVRIIAPGRVYTRTRGLEAEWAMDVRLTGDVAHPALFGEARVVRGDFLLAGRRFDLDHGAVRFAGAPEDAEIDVLAIAETQTLTANLALTGRAIDPKVELSSQPALPEDEILPELLFGRTSRELSGFEAAQLAASLATLAGRSAFDIAGAARAAVDLDRLEVREDMGGFLVAGGKYLTRNVYVEVSGNAVGQAGTAIEWQVRPRFFLISSFLPTGDQKVAIRWRHDY